MLSLDGATATGLGTAIGQAPPAAASTATVAITGGEIRFHGPDGLSALMVDGRVSQFTAFKPQTTNNWTIPLTLEDNDQKLGTLTRGSTFAAAATLLGSAHDATGQVVVASPIGPITAQVRIWASAGIRIVGTCLGACSESTAITSITLSPPFLGKDGTVGIGASRADLELDVGDPENGGAPDSAGVVVYKGAGRTPALGGVFAEGSACVERVGGFVFGYVNPT